MANICFICGIEKMIVYTFYHYFNLINKFEKDGEGWKKHIQIEHNL